LKRIDGVFDAFVTIDRNLPAQQKVSGLAFGVVALQSASNRLEDLKQLVPKILEALGRLAPGQVIVVQADA